MIYSLLGMFMGFQMMQLLKNPPAIAGDARDFGLIPGSGSSSGIRNGNPFWYSCLENSMDRVGCIYYRICFRKQCMLYAPN